MYTIPRAFSFADRTRVSSSFFYQIAAQGFSETSAVLTPHMLTPRFTCETPVGYRINNASE